MAVEPFAKAGHVEYRPIRYAPYWQISQTIIEIRTLINSLETFPCDPWMRKYINMPPNSRTTIQSISTTIGVSIWGCQSRVFKIQSLLAVFQNELVKQSIGHNTTSWTQQDLRRGGPVLTPQTMRNKVWSLHYRGFDMFKDLMKPQCFFCVINEASCLSLQ